MEASVNVKVTVDLGERTMSLFSGFMAANNAVATAADAAGKVLEKYASEEEAAPADKPAPRTRSRNTKTAEAPAPTKEEKTTAAVEAPTSAPAKDVPVEFKDMDDDAKLEAIRAEVSKNVKKGRSGDVKFMLAQFDASNATTLTPESYGAFYDAIVRYGNGEALEDIFPSDLD